MTKYHIASDGKPAICKAKIRCRRGGKHYDTKEEAKVASLQADVSGLLKKPERPKNHVGNFPVPEGDVRELLCGIMNENNDEETWESVGLHYSDSKANMVQDFIIWPNQSWNGPNEVLAAVNILEEFVSPEMEYSDEDGNEHPYLQHELLRGKAIAWVQNVKAQLNHDKAPTPEPELDSQKWPVDSSGSTPGEDPQTGDIVYRLPITGSWRGSASVHREDGPAVIQPNGTKKWLQRNRLHRLDGPAITYEDGRSEYWVDGIEVRDVEDFPLAASSYIPGLGEKDIFKK